MSHADAGPRRLPAEWEPQSGVQLTWPHADTDWHEDLDAVEPVFARIGAEIASRETLLSVCQTATHRAHVQSLLLAQGAPMDGLRFALAPSDDTWARDHGPLTVLLDRKPCIVDFRFNGWGGKFCADADDAISQTLADQGCYGKTALERQTLVLEGGALETDGQGTLLATRHSLITGTRNPGLDQAQIEQSLSRILGIQRFLWLDHGALSGDDTDGHIDTLARFCDPQTIVYATAEANDRDYPALQQMQRQLRELRQSNGKPYRLQALPPPGEHQDVDGRRLPASYANFLIINGALLVPVYGVASDALALQVLAECFPDRDMVAIDCRAVIRQNGSLHCLTMQYPHPVHLQSGA